MVFCFKYCSDQILEKIVVVIEKKKTEFEERKVRIFETEYFFNLLLGVSLISNKQLKCQLKQIIVM